MKKNSSPRKNFIYNIVYQILILIIPLITAPYLSRVVGARGVGTYSYTYSIVYYFVLLSMLGINNYGNREIAKNRDNQKEMACTFWSIYAIEFIATILMIICYGVYLYFFVEEYLVIARIQSLFIIASLFDINWFFFGTEKFKLTITRNTIIKILNVILIFTFVKTCNDLWKYTLIMSGMTLLSQLILWPTLLKEIGFVEVKELNIKKHIKPCFILFIPIIAISLYKFMDKIMIGAIANMKFVGYYDNAEKIINICMTLETALGTVMLPMISKLYSNGEINKIKGYILKSIKFTAFLAFPIMFGLMVIAKDFSSIYFGKEFAETGNALILLSMTIPIISIANVIRKQYLIPTENDNAFIFSVILGAIINLIINFALIPKYQAIGACIGTIAAEFSVLLCQMLFVRKDLPLKEYFKESFQFFVKGLIMFLLILPINFIKISSILKLVLEVIIGIILYASLNLKYINSEINLKKIICNIRRKKYE